MKSILKKIIVEILIFEARLVLKKYKPFIIAVTGSVGKTSTKDAIYTVLSSKFKVRKSEKSFNSEFGVPLTILGRPSGWHSPRIWLGNIFHGLDLILFGYDYPKYLVLEVGADHPGDIRNITKWVHPDISIITKVSKVPVHVEFFKSPVEVAVEKAYLAKGLTPGGTLILSKELDITAPQAGKTLYFDSENIKSVEVAYDGRPIGMNIVLNIDGEEKTITTKGVIGDHHVYPLVIAIMTGKAVGMTLDEAIVALGRHKAPTGRMNVLMGKNDMTLIDDTYNSSPDALHSALTTLKGVTGPRRVAILGDMLELGKYAVEEHAKAGQYARTCADLVISVGLRARGMHAHHHFNTSIEGAEKIPALLKAGDVVLIKGSQGIRMERIAKALLDPSLNSANVLVRQEKEWQNK